METLLVIDENAYEHVGTSSSMMKFADFDVMYQVDHSALFHNAEKEQIHSITFKFRYSRS